MFHARPCTRAKYQALESWDRGSEMYKPVDGNLNASTDPRTDSGWVMGRIDVPVGEEIRHRPKRKAPRV